MGFDDLDSRMRVFETAHDHCVLPGVWMVARLDGRGFTKLARGEHAFDAPFDDRFHACMIAATRALMDCGFGMVLGYTQSDEISMLLMRDDRSFGRKERKLNSLLASEASVAFTQMLGSRAVFDCRISQLPTWENVRDYFLWRQADATRNALNGYCYWHLRDAGRDAATATQQLRGLSVAAKNELLFQGGINFNDTPSWHRRGSCVVWETFWKEGVNPNTGESVVSARRRLAVEEELPMKAAFAEWVKAQAFGT